VTGERLASEQSERVDEHTEPAVEPRAGSGAKPVARARRERPVETNTAPASTTLTGYADITVQIPASIAQAIDRDPRSRPAVFRDAFEDHVEAVVAGAPRRPAPKIPGMERPKARRRADPDDPFVEVLFRMRRGEKAAYLEWVARTDLSSSAFATEMLRKELLSD
jgi:hypothetical protein